MDTKTPTKKQPEPVCEPETEESPLPPWEKPEPAQDNEPPPWEKKEKHISQPKPSVEKQPAEAESYQSPPWETPEPSVQEKAPFFREEPISRAPSLEQAHVPESETENKQLLAVFNFLKDNVFKSPTGEFFPIYLLIGLSGAGKTTYLTMLGNILEAKNMRYYFPWKGIDIRTVKIGDIFDTRYSNAQASGASSFRRELTDRVRDLVFEFSHEKFRNTIAKGIWDVSTPRDEGSTLFLLTDVLKNHRTIARLVTFETSGEDFEDAIKMINRIRHPHEVENPVQRIILELMNYAEGFIVLIDPANESNDEIFSNLFREMQEEIEPRAMNALYRSAKEVLVSPEDMLEKGKPAKSPQDDIRAELERKVKEREARARREREIINTKKILLEKLQIYRQKIETEGVETILVEDKEGFITDLQNLAMSISNQVQQARENLLAAEADEARIKSYYKGLLKLCISGIDKLAEKYYDEQQLAKAGVDAEKDPDRIQKAFNLVLEKKGVQMSMTPDPKLPTDLPSKKFHRLKDLAIVVTKSDMYQIVYPPEKYPDFKIPSCKRSLEYIENYLKFMDGRVSYYNSSVSGYSILKDTRYYPGAENTLTPINIIEPIFDMLRLK